MRFCIKYKRSIDYFLKLISAESKWFNSNLKFNYLSFELSKIFPLKKFVGKVSKES